MTTIRSSVAAARNRLCSVAATLSVRSNKRFTSHSPEATGGATAESDSTRVERSRLMATGFPPQVHMPAGESLDGVGAADHDCPYVFGRLPRACSVPLLDAPVRALAAPPRTDPRRGFDASLMQFWRDSRQLLGLSSTSSNNARASGLPIGSWCFTCAGLPRKICHSCGPRASPMARPPAHSLILITYAQAPNCSPGTR